MADTTASELTSSSSLIAASSHVLLCDLIAADHVDHDVDPADHVLVYFNVIGDMSLLYISMGTCIQDISIYRRKETHAI